MKNLDFLKYLRDQEDAAYERIKLGHFDENGAAYYRGKHDQAFAMRRDLEERLQQNAAIYNKIAETGLDILEQLRKHTLGRKCRAMIDDVRECLKIFVEPIEKEDEK